MCFPLIRKYELIYNTNQEICDGQWKRETKQLYLIKKPCRQNSISAVWEHVSLDSNVEPTSPSLLLYFPLTWHIQHRAAFNKILLHLLYHSLFHSIAGFMVYHLTIKKIFINSLRFHCRHYSNTFLRLWKFKAIKISLYYKISRRFADFYEQHLQGRSLHENLVFKLAEMIPCGEHSSRPWGTWGKKEMTKISKLM